ncbi:MAG: DNA translocase FtsK 4TM domain-containing protein [Flavobacteriales bacterium]
MEPYYYEAFRKLQISRANLTLAKNTIKNSEEDSIGAGPPWTEPHTEKASRPKKQKSAGTGRWAGLKAFVADPRVQKITGIFLVLFSVFVFLSCTSYLFTGSHDFLLVTADEATVEFSQNEPYKNWMGKIGAHVAWFFMNKYFGLGALFIPLILFMVGIRVWLKRDLLPFWKTMRLSILAMFFFPLAIGFLFHHRVDGFDRTIEITCNQNLVGGYGHFATEWCTFTLGWFGTLMFLLFVIGAFLMFNYSAQVEGAGKRLIEWWRNRAKAIAPEEEEEDEQPKTKDAKAAAAAAVASNAFAEEEDGTTVTNNFKPEPTQAMEAEEEDAFEIVTNNEPEYIPVVPALELEPIEITADTMLPAGTVATETIGEGGMDIAIEGVEEELTEAEIERTLEKLGPFDPKKDLPRYELPSIEMLKPHGGQGPQINKEELEANKNKIVETLNQYKIEIAKIKASIGPTVTLYEIVPAPGVRISKIKSLEDDIALSLAALGIRIIAPIPGKGTIGIEVPNSKPDVVSMRALIASEKFQNAEMELPIALGKTISNENYVVDLAKMPHLLMAGATGQGKSVGLNAILVSLLYKKHPAEIKFVLVDPKKVELTLFNKIERHFLAKLPGTAEPIITDTAKVVKTLQSLCIEMDNRYELLKMAACRNIKEYNGKFVQRRLNPENGHRYLPYIVLVVDEFADLIMTAGREVETPIARLAQLARAIGIHLIIATQRPSVNIITGTIKANFPSRIAFRVTSKIDSRTILDTGGADQLIGRGDMLYSTGNDLIRLQCGFVDTPEVEEITDMIGNQQGYPDALLLPEVFDENALDVDSFDPGDRDELFSEAARIVVSTQQGSASLLQRKLKLGYNRAGRLVDQLEAAGVIGPFEGSKARKVLIPDEITLEQFLKNSAANPNY